MVTTPAFRAVVLGSAQDGGNPQLGQSSGLGPPRAAASLALVADDGFAMLVDASPDLRSQYEALTASHPRAERRAAFDAVALTHAHMGHYAGLVHFGKEAAAVDAMPCFASASMLSFLEDNEPWAVMFRDGRLVPAPLEPTVPVHVGERLQLIGHVVPHRPDFTDALALEFRSPTGSLLYLPDIDNWDDWPALDDVVGGVDVALVDATFHSTDEHPGRDLSAIPHPLVGTTLRRFRAHLEDTRVILTHLNWTNPLSDPDSAAAAEATALGYEIAFDGMEVPV